ncbi:MAG: cobalamin-dependent protein [Nitriliruptor sp.]
MTGIEQGAVLEYLDLASAGRRHDAVRLVLDALDDGVPASVVVTDLVGAAQREVGERWLRAEWSTADEHLVTSVSQAALEAVSHAKGAASEVGPTVVVACAESDWHGLPAQMFAELLRDQGLRTFHLGASTPADDVATFVGRRRPDAVAVTCNLALSYLGVARLVDAAHRSGTPAIVGGRAMTAARARVLGADGWAADAEEAASIVRGWVRSAPPVPDEATALDAGALALDEAAVSFADVAFDDLERRFPPLVTYDLRQRMRTREDLAYIVRYLAAARLVGDPEVFTDFCGWLTDLLEARGVPPRALAAGIESLLPHLRGIDEGAADLAIADNDPRWRIA